MINARKAQLMTKSYEKYVLDEQRRSFERRVDSFYTELYTSCKTAFDRGIAGNANTGRRYFEKQITYVANDKAKEEAVKRTVKELKTVLNVNGFAFTAKVARPIGFDTDQARIVTLTVKW